MPQVAFSASLLRVHIDEASFLYEQGIGELPELFWGGNNDFEQRLEAHIDGLDVGGSLALALCTELITEGDAGELYAAIRIFCRQGRFDLLERVLEDLDVSDGERVAAVTDALTIELPPAWNDKIAAMLSNENELHKTIAAQVIGYRRLPFCDALLSHLSDASPNVLLSMASALGTLRDPKARQPLIDFFYDSEEGDSKKVCAVALLRIGESNIVRSCLDVAESNPWATLPVALAAGRDAVQPLIDVARRNARPDILTALGILGDPSAIDTLLTALADPELAEASALSLNLITGADLYEEVFLPEEIDPDELFDDEREKIKNGEPLYGLDEEQPGTTIIRLTQAKEHWGAWCRDNAERFESGIRYRNGIRFAPECLIQNLESEKSPRSVRQWAYDELVIRYDIDVRFETDMLVKDQVAAIEDLAGRVRERSTQFESGRWYFAGKPTKT